MKNPRLISALLIAMVIFAACTSRKAPAASSEPQASYLGQDGGDFAGRLCSSGNTTDNIHIHISGLRTDEAPTGYLLVDDGPGVWATPCDPQSNWLLFVKSKRRGEADLYFKPYQNTTGSETYTLTLKYAYGSSQVLKIKAEGGTATTAGPEAALEAKFLGQDGGNYAGKLCSSGAEKDNIHIRLSSLKTNATPVRYSIEDQSGLWATPCDPASNWLLFVSSPVKGQADLYFKPYRDAPDGTIYTITIEYDDGTSQRAAVAGKRVKP